MTRFSLVVGLLSCLAAATSVPAQSGPLATESPEARADKLFEGWDNYRSPGCALVVIHNGQIVHERGYGMANLDHDIRITPATVFHVASVSKQFTAAAIVLLAQQGKLSLDDDIRQHLPELPDFGRRITVRHLVHHTSGLRDQWSLLELAGWRYSLDLITDDDVLTMMRRQKALNFAPGEKHVYSNTGYTLMAQIVKRASGQSFRQFMETNFFQPLGMKSTFFRDDHAEVVKNQAYGYETADKGTYKLSVTNFDTVGATSLLTTVEDLARWDQNFYDRKVGSEAFFRQMEQVGRLNNGEELGYAFGLFLDTYRGLRVVEHSGGDAGYQAHLVRFPEQRFSVACLCNRSDANPYDLARRVADIYLEGQFKQPPPAAANDAGVPVSEQALAGREGFYWNRESDAFAKISASNGRLLLGFWGETFPLIALAEDRFKVGPFSAEIVFDHPAVSARPRMAVVWSGEKPDYYELVTQHAPAAGELAAFAGTYVSDEVEPFYRFELEDDKLVLHRLKNKPEALEPVLPDVFAAPLGTIRFERDAAGRVSGFVLNAGRIRNFQFKKQPSS